MKNGDVPHATDLVGKLTSRPRPIQFIFLVVVVAGAASVAWNALDITAPASSLPEFLNDSATELITPIPRSIALSPAKVALGKKLFFDTLLSKDRSIACVDCHSLEKGGADGRSRSIGIGGSEGPINAPTVFNSGFNFKQFWDGRAATLEEQMEGPLLSPIEMGATWEELLHRLRNSPEYPPAFRQIYPEGIQASNVRNAIAEFQRSLITPNSRVDNYLRGDKKALGHDEIEGFRKFNSYGCVTCHNGVNLGGNMFQPIGLLGNYFADRGNITSADYGRFNVTKNEEDRFHFKVPGLRNVALTAPYFHDGSNATLEEAIDTMAKYQLGRSIPTQDRDQIVAFLRTLTGEYDGSPLER